MIDDDTNRTISRLSWSWWFVWGVIFLLAAVTPYLHFRWRVAEIIEPLRYSWGLLPAHWLFFRNFGELAGYVFIGVIAAGVGAWLRPAKGKTYIVLSAMVTLAFIVAYASYCGFLVIEFIASETRQIEVDRAEPLIP